MNLVKTLLIFVITVTASFCDVAAVNNKRFPPNFMFGVGTSAYQIEGAWNVDGKTESIWDNYIHNTPGYVADNSTGDVACDSYNRWMEDVEMLKVLGVNHYRFSIAWTRVLPRGYDSDLNLVGLNYYKTLISALKQNNIEPMVSMFHWDLPQSLQEMGGFLNESVVDWFADYSRVLYKYLGDDVKYWFTFNEPKSYCNGGYGYAYNPPRIPSEGLLEYVCSHNLLKAHAKAYRIYDQEFRERQQGKVSIVLDTQWFRPATNSSADQVATDTAYHFELGWYANPVHYGDYPDIMKSRIAARSAAEGRNQSRLPEFTEHEKAQLRGSTDFFAVNTYTGYLAAAVDPPVTNPPSRYGDMGVNTMQPPGSEVTTLSWLYVAPWGMRLMLNWIKSTYGNPDIVITENGYPDFGGLEDAKRLDYHREYLSYTRDATAEDGVRVFGYTAWSLMDNFEWASGYTQKFGLYQVDFSNPNRTRTAKQSAKYFAQVCRTKCLVDQCID